MKVIRYLIISLLGVIFSCAVVTDAVAKRLVPDTEKKRIIVLDPGHGGHDHGAQGSEGTLEKDIVLKLARMIAAEFKNKYRVVLTRADDYRLDIPDRTATANHFGADVFISLHTGGSFLHKAGGATIFYYKDSARQAWMLEKGLPEQDKPVTNRILWENIQIKHIMKSKVLAKSLYDHINGNVNLVATKIQSAPLMVLEGADMPAILLEIGCLSNPVEGKKLKDAAMLSNLAREICDGIDDFLLKSRE